MPSAVRELSSIYSPVLRAMAASVLCASIGAQVPATSSVSDIFFLDLGIVIEPSEGNETYSRVVASTSDEVKFRVKKVRSGSVYMASSKEMMSTLERIQERIASLDRNFRNGMVSMKKENLELKSLISELKLPPPEPIVLAVPEEQPEPGSLIVDKETVALKETEENPAERTLQKIFNTSKYMAGVFAYQRENYTQALEHFLSLNLETAPARTADNIKYWTADSYLQLGQHGKALELLEQILSDSDYSRPADALIQTGLVYRKLGREEDALAVFSEMVEHHPESEYVRLAKMELKKAEFLK